MDVDEVVESEMLYTTKFEESSDFNKAYLCKENMSSLGKLKTKDRIPIGDQGHTTENYQMVLKVRYGWT